MKKIFICSRYAGDVTRNVTVAEQLCRKAVEHGCAPFAPHLLFTRFLDDEKASEREIGIACGLMFMKSCDEVWAYIGDGVSSGMRREMDHALCLGKTVVEIKEF